MVKKLFILLIVAGVVFFVWFLTRENIPEINGRVTIVAFGDSLTEGYGINKENAYPSQLAKKLQADTIDAMIINKGVSGDSSLDALNRIDEVISLKPDIVILAIGSNDGLRSYDINTTRENVSKIIKKLKENNIKIVFCGMRLTFIKGIDYGKKFKEMYSKLADEHKLIFMPVFLEDVIMRPKYNIEDGIHPNKEGYKIITNNLYPYVIKAIKEL